MQVDEDLITLVSEQRRELEEARAVDSDLCFAYQLQMQEAMTASLLQTGAPSSSNPTVPDETATDYAFQLLADEISDYERQLLDRTAAEDEMRRIRNDLNRSIHDHAFARELLAVPDGEWRNIGDNIEKPYLEGGAGAALGKGVVVNDEDCFRVHVKGSVVNRERNTFVGGIGVAVFDMNDALVFQVSKGVVGAEMSGEVVEVKALVEGLHVASILGLQSALIVCDSNLIYQCFTGKCKLPRQDNLAKLVDHVTVLQRNLIHCKVSLANDVGFASRLAQDAIGSKARELVGNTSGEEVIETCAICLEDINTNLMFSVDGCLHRYCFNCLRRHVEVKLLYGILPLCPHEGCQSRLKTDGCEKFLTPELFDILNKHVMEASIPPANKLYCPYPTCSALMARSNYVRDGLAKVMITCEKCDRPFCANCKVPWHYNMTCSLYKQRNPNPCPEDAKLKTLAAESRWRQCRVCSVMVSLTEGCNHIYCRCGHEFCYICGVAWMNKKATCCCPLWDEKNIIRER